MTDFDRYAEEYRTLLDASVSSSGFPSTFFAERKAQEIARTLAARRIGTQGLRLLNFGCGIGLGEPSLTRSLPGAALFSIDISRKSIEIARNRNRDLAAVRFSEFDGHRIPFPGMFDVILLAGVLHHVRPAERLTVVGGLRERLAQHGFLFIFEHNPWNPLTRRAVRECPFDDHAELLSGRMLRRLLLAAGYRVRPARYIHFFPKALAALIPAERWLGSIPLGAQYYYVASR